MLENINTLKERSQEIIQPLGIAVMTAATIFGMVESPDHLARAIVPSSPVLTSASQNGEDNNPMRREKDEVSTHYISYGVSQRTPGRSGRE